MEKIIEAQPMVLNILGKIKCSESVYRMMKYCLSVGVDDGILLYNLLTRELILLTQEEYEQRLESQYLRERWFVVPNEVNEKEYTDLVRWVFYRNRRKLKEINHYTILTTTDCNARCFYCFEKGRTKITMNEEVAGKVSEFIKKHCNDGHVSLSWFGGEPLMNCNAIDIICEKLQEAGIEYRSGITTNGYLFNEEIITKAKKLWKLKSVQITLDGTENIYNRIKAYVYKDVSAYQIVLDNIELLLKSGMKIFVRVNMDLHNAENIMNLAEELIFRFSKYEKFSIYPYVLIDAERTLEDRHSIEEWETVYHKLFQLKDQLIAYGKSRETAYRLRREFPNTHCKADSGNSVLIAPDGHLGLCEYYTESEFLGHVDSEEWDQEMILSWQEHRDELPECKDCFFYPECNVPKKCKGHQPCFEYEQKDIRRRVEKSMINEYHCYRKENGAEK